MKANKSLTYNKKETIIFPYKYGFIKDSGNDMSRILTNLKNGACIIGAMRSECDDKENLKRTELLELDLKNLGLGYRPSIGGFVENKDTPDEVEVEELSFIVPYNNKFTQQEFLNMMLRLCNKYSQESILISLPEFNDGKACYVKGDGEIDFSFNKIGLPKNPTYYTKPIKHNTPKFEFSDSTYNIYELPELNLKEVAQYYSKCHIRLNPNTSEVRHYDNGWRNGEN